MTTLTDSEKLLVIHLVIQTYIKPSNKYFRNAITKIQRFWRKRSGYYGYTPLTEFRIFIRVGIWYNFTTTLKKVHKLLRWKMFISSTKKKM